MDWRVPLADVKLGVEEENAVLEVLRSGWLTMGEVTQAFEQELAAFVGAKHAFAVNNATAALHLACLAVGVGEGDEVIVPSLTFVATANAVRYTGAKAVFADIESEDWLCICPRSIEEKITERTKAIEVMQELQGRVQGYFGRIMTSLMDELSKAERLIDGALLPEPRPGQEVLTELRAQEIRAYLASLDDVLAATRNAPLPVALALDRVQDPGNVGTLARTLYALGGGGILLPRHEGARLGPGAAKASAGALARLPVAKVTNLAQALDTALDAGFAVIGAAGEEGAENALAATAEFPLLLVLGNEDAGIRAGIRKRCGRLWRIPLARPIDSLNVAQAGAIILGRLAALVP